MNRRWLIAILVICHECGARGRVNESHAGRRIKCPKCGAKHDVPLQETSVIREQVSENDAAKPRLRSAGIWIVGSVVALALLVGASLYLRSASTKNSLQVVEWYFVESLPNLPDAKTVFTRSAMKDQTYVVVKSKINGRVPWVKPGKEGEPWAIDRNQFSLKTATGERIKSEFIGEQPAEGLGALFTLVEGAENVVLPPVVFHVGRAQVDEGGCEFNHIVFPPVLLTKENKRSPSEPRR